MPDGIIRMGLVGAGANTRRRHIPGLREQQGVEIVSVANRSRESGERVAGEFEIPTVYDSWLELIRADDTDAICIGTWPYMHKTLTLAALENEKHVLCEARMAMNAREAREMLDASRQKPHLVTQIGTCPSHPGGGRNHPRLHRQRLPWRDSSGALESRQHRRTFRTGRTPSPTMTPRCTGGRTGT